MKREDKIFKIVERDGGESKGEDKERKVIEDLIVEIEIKKERLRGEGRLKYVNVNKKICREI